MRKMTEMKRRQKIITQTTMTANSSKPDVKASSIQSDVRSKPPVRVCTPFCLFLAIIDLATGTTLHIQRPTKKVLSTSSPYSVGNKGLIENVATFINTAPRPYIPVYLQQIYFYFY
jgi:hypothetical protein